MMKKLLALILCLAPVFAIAAERNSVVAIVNDDPITSLDVSKRTQFIIKSSGMSNDARTRSMIKDKVLQILIDEKIFEQEARKHNISVEDSDMNFALNALAEKNNIKRRQLNQYLKQRGISSDVFEAQLHHQLLWNKIITTRIRPRVSVTDKEVEENKASIIAQVKSMQKKEVAKEAEVKLAEIVIYFSADEEENQKQVELAKQLVAEIRGGADFASLAEKFSQSAGASQGGEIGWLYPSQLNKKISSAVKRLRTGKVSDPVVLDDGVHILKALARKALPAPPKTDSAISTAQVKEVMFNTKLNLQMKSYMRKLRREAFIDIK